MTGLTRPALASHRNFRSRRVVGVVNVKNGPASTVLQVERDQKLKNQIKLLKYKSNGKSEGQLILEIEHLMALVLNTFMWSSWYGNFGLTNQEEVCIEITNLINQLLQDLTRRSQRVGEQWVPFVANDVVGVLSDWIDGYEHVFALRDGNETIYSKALIRHMLIESLEADQTLLIDFLVGLIDGVVIKSIVDGYSDNFAIWGIIDRVCDEILEDSKSDTSTTTDRAPNQQSRQWGLSYINVQEPSVRFSYEDMVPILRLVSQTTRLCEYPLLWCMVTMVLRAALAVPMLNNVISNAICEALGNTINEPLMCKIVQILKKAMYPGLDSDTGEWCQWGLKPRWCPESPEQLQALKHRCQVKVDHVYEKFSALSFWWIIAGNGTSFVSLFDDKRTNKVLIWGLIDSLVNLLYKSRA